MYHAFERYSRHYIVEFNECQSLFEDFKLLNEEKEIETFIEVKDRHCRLQLNSNDESLSLCHQRYRLGEKFYLMFSWKSQWNYLFTVLDKRYSYEERSIVMLFRDEISLNWWNAYENNEETKFVWHESKLDYFANHLIETADMKVMIKIMKRIIRKYEPMTQNLILVVPRSEMIEIEDDMMTESNVDIIDVQFDQSSERHLSATKRKNQANYFKDRTYQIIAFEVLLRLCRHRYVARRWSMKVDANLWQFSLLAGVKRSLSKWIEATRDASTQ